jgi:signal transduction histidine kinase
MSSLYTGLRHLLGTIWSPRSHAAHVRQPATRSTWFYAASLLQVAVATVILVEGWSGHKQYMTIVIPLALVFVGIAASFWRLRGALTSTALSCGLLLAWRTAHTEPGVIDIVGASLYCITALVLAVLAIQRRALEDRLMIQKEKLEDGLEREAALGRYKDEFLSLVAHELRNPVAVLVGSSDLLARGKILGSEKEEVVKDISIEARRVQRLIEDLLSLSRFDKGLRPEPEPILLNQVAASAIEQFHERYSQPVTLNLDKQLPLAAGSSVQVERVLSNLLSNAGKYSPRHSPISLEARLADGMLEIDILDRGPGVPVEDTSLIFEAFQRLPGHEETRGYGLGLAISKRLVEANGGRIWARNRPSGGLDVGFSLPLYGAESPPASSSSVQQDI